MWYCGTDIKAVIESIPEEDTALTLNTKVRSRRWLLNLQQLGSTYEKQIDVKTVGSVLSKGGSGEVIHWCKQDGWLKSWLSHYSKNVILITQSRAFYKCKRCPSLCTRHGPFERNYGSYWILPIYPKIFYHKVYQNVLEQCMVGYDCLNQWN